MLRVLNLNVNSIANLSENFTNLQIVRWRRKPRWLPVAKSKMFRVPPRRTLPPEEKSELMRLFNNYRTQMKGIRSYLHKEYNKSVVIDTAQHEKEFAEDFAACSAINNAWNEEIRKLRELHHDQELKKAKEIAYRRLDENSERQKQKIELVEEIVRKEKELSKDFITPETLNEAIERAIANPVDYNFSIDLNGNIYKGFDAKPEEPQQKVKIVN